MLLRQDFEIASVFLITIPRTFGYPNQTSKCTSRNKRTLEDIVDRNTSRKVHTILKSKSCSTVWNSDVNAAKNIHHVFTYQANHNDERLSIFQRPPPLTQQLQHCRIPCGL
ncbi:hypothetical protein BD560DRAFT_424892 [Blakeslea trispora]|nr:hypothetical protein BD560DRAFT_424892 [Blakeslea trispora]